LCPLQSLIERDEYEHNRGDSLHNASPFEASDPEALRILAANELVMADFERELPEGDSRTKEFTLGTVRAADA
jgi:hypothetical protein